MSLNESYSPGYEAERTPSPPPLPPLPDTHAASPVTSSPPSLPPLPASASTEHIVLSMQDESPPAPEADIEPGSPLPPPSSPPPTDDNYSIAMPPSFLLPLNRSWATLPTPMLVSTVLATPASPDSAPQHPQQHERDEDRDGRYVTHRPLPIHTAGSGGPSATIHHSLNPPHSDVSGASSSPWGVSPADAADGLIGEEERRQQSRDDTLEAHVLKTPTSGGGGEEEVGAADAMTVRVTEADEDQDVEKEMKEGDDREGSPLDNSTIRYGTAGSDLPIQLTARQAAPGEGEMDQKEENEANTSNESFHYSPHGTIHDNLHIHTTATTEPDGTLGNYHTLSVPSRISDTTVPFQTMSRISDTTVPYTMTMDAGVAEYQYTYNQEQEGLVEQGRLSSNPLSPSLASPSYHALNSPLTPTATHPLAYHSIHSPNSPSAPTMPYQQTISSMGPVSYSAAQMRAFSPSLNDASMREEYKTGEVDGNIAEGAASEQHAPGGVAVMIDDEKEPGEALEPEVLEAIARLEAGEPAESNVVRVSVGEDGSTLLPAHASEMELQRYGSGLPAAYGGAAAVVVGSGIVDDGGEGVNMHKEGQSTPMRIGGSNRSSRSQAKSPRSSKRSSRSRPAPRKPPVRWPVFTAFFVTAVVIVFLLEFQYEDWTADSLYENPMYGPHPSTMLHFGAKFTPALLLHGQHWRLIASMLLHSGAIHCIFSLVVGVMYAYQFEREHGWWRVFPCWVISGVFGQLFSSLLSPMFVSVGGSAAVCGLVSGWVGDWLHSWDRIENHWSYGYRHFFCMCIVFTAGVFPFNDNYAALGACACGVACGLVAYAPVHRKADARWQLGDFGSWRVTGFKKVLLGIVLVLTIYAVVCGLLFGRSVDSLYGCENCHWVGCIDTPLWSCSAGIPTDCFDATGHLTHTSKSSLC